MANVPPTKDFFPSPALSLSLAGIFRGAAAAEVEGAGDEGSVGGGRGTLEETAEISSENSGPARSRSGGEDFFEGDEDDDEEDGDDGGGGDKNRKKKRKKYHRHTAEQIREMEALFKESPHPDVKQRQQLSKQLGLHPRQVKFWFQNRRTQIKAIQERHENSLLKIEIDKLKEGSKSLRETIHMSCCANCGFATTSNDDASVVSEDQQLRIENAKLKAENQWKEMFPCLVSKAATVDVIHSGEGANRSGAVQLMFAELQMLTPMVPTRELYFVRYCKQLSAEQWAIVDVSIDKVEDNMDAASLVKCRKRPSGCIIEDKSNGHCKVTWVEHLQCQKSTVHSLYRTIVSSGLAFGARHWVVTLQLQCERLMFFMATNVPTKDSNGVVATLAGRKSILKLAQRLTWSFCRALGASSSFNSWTKVPSKTGEDIRVASRKNLNDPGEPIGVILSAVSSLWLPVSPTILFDFLRDDTRRHEAIESKENNSSMWVIQDSCTNAYESMVVYAHADMTGMQSVMTGCDSSGMAILPSGFSILSDGLESRPLLITSRQDQEKSSDSEGGSLLTIGLQIVTSAASPTAKVSMESITTIICCTLRNIDKLAM